MAIADIVKEADADETGFRSLFVTAPDGLRLHVRRYGERGRGLPIVCLPGLTRNGADFHELATALTRDAAQPRLVITINSRGRGRSDHDPDPDELFVPGRACRRDRGHHGARDRPGDLPRHLARRHPDHAARRGAADRDRRRDPERHRSGDRRARA